MKIVHKNQTKEFKNSDKCIAIEYPLGDKDINGCVIKGKGKIVVEDKGYSLNSGDLVLINVNERYYWQGNLEMFVPCVPAWYPEQHQTVE